jgi:hypothetical protein
MLKKFGVRVIHRCALYAGKYGNLESNSSDKLTIIHVPAKICFRVAGAKFRFSHPAVYVGSIVGVISLMVAIVTYVICHASIQMSKKTKHSLVNTWVSMALLCFMYR